VSQQRIDEGKRQFERHMDGIAKRRGDMIHSMKVINEPLCGSKDPDYRHSADSFWEDALIPWSFDAERRYLPKNTKQAGVCGMSAAASAGQHEDG